MSPEANPHPDGYSCDLGEAFAHHTKFLVNHGKLSESVTFTPRATALIGERQGGWDVGDPEIALQNYTVLIVGWVEAMCLEFDPQDGRRESVTNDIFLPCGGVIERYRVTVRSLPDLPKVEHYFGDLRFRTAIEIDLADGTEPSPIYDALEEPICNDCLAKRKEDADA